MTDTPTIKKRVDELQTQVNAYTGKKSFVSGIGGISLNSPKLYYIIPIVLFLLLAIFRPGFLYDTDMDKNRKFSVKKFLSFWLLFSGMLIIGLIVYNHKKE